MRESSIETSPKIHSRQYIEETNKIAHLMSFNDRKSVLIDDILILILLLGIKFLRMMPQIKKSSAIW